MKPLFVALREEKGPIPFAAWLARLCEEFNCLPSAAYREWLICPSGLLDDVLEARAFMRALEAYDHAETKTDLPQTPMIDLITEIEFELVEAEELEKRKAQQHG